MVGWMSYWSQRSETGVRSRRWSRRMAAFSWALGRFRVFLGMGEPPLEIVAYSSGPFFPFRLKQNSFRVFLDMGGPPLEVVAYSSRRFVPFQLKQNRPT